MIDTYYAIFASAKGGKDLVRVVRSADYASYLSGVYHRQLPTVNYKVWKSDHAGEFHTYKEKPIIINGIMAIGKGAH